MEGCVVYVVAGVGFCCMSEGHTPTPLKRGTAQSVLYIFIYLMRILMYLAPAAAFQEIHVGT
jgi:hypothetical protein